jgi:hypothetical protein
MRTQNYDESGIWRIYQRYYPRYFEVLLFTLVLVGRYVNLNLKMFSYDL